MTLLDHIRGGLAWLALHQTRDGRLSEAASTARCRDLGHDPPCVGAPQLGGTISTTALGLLALIEHRDLDDTGLFEPALAAAARWLVRQQRANGSFSLDADDYPYSHAIALTALGHAAASSGDADLRAAVERGLAHLASREIRTLATRDLSTLTYVAQAVEAARRADVPLPQGLDVELRASLGKHWIGEHRFRQHSGAREEEPSLAPVGMVAGTILWEGREPSVAGSWRSWLRSRPAAPRPSPYTLYYGVRMTIDLEGDPPHPWRGWLLSLAGDQAREGDAAGSFPDLPGGWWMGPTTRAPTFQTAVAVLTLERALHRR